MMTESGFDVLPHYCSLSLGLNRPILTSRTVLSYTYLTVVHQKRHLFWYAFFSFTKPKISILVYTKTVDQTPNILCSLVSNNSGKMASRFVSVTSEEIIQINDEENR